MRYVLQNYFHIAETPLQFNFVVSEANFWAKTTFNTKKKNNFLGKMLGTAKVFYRRVFVTYGSYIPSCSL